MHTDTNMSVRFKLVRNPSLQNLYGTEEYSGKNVKEEILIWCKLSFFAGLREFADLFPWLVSISFVGHISTTDLAALSIIEVLIYTLMDITWWAVSMTESVLVSQAHGSQCLLSMRGWALMSFIVMTFCNILIALLCLFSREILIYFGFESSIAERGSVFARLIIPALFAEGINICIGTYMTAFQEASIPTYIQLVSALLNLFLTYIFIFGVGNYAGVQDSLKACAFGWVISSIVGCFLTGIALYKVSGKELDMFKETSFNSSVTGSTSLLELDDSISSEIVAGGMDNSSSSEFSSECSLNEPLLLKPKKLGVFGSPFVSTLQQKSFVTTCHWMNSRRRWIKYLEQALPNFITTGLQCVSLFIMSFLAAKLGNVQIAAHNSSIALFEVLYTLVQGMGEGTSIRIGYHIGKGNIKAAKGVVYIAFIVSLLWGLAVAGVGSVFRHGIAEILSNDQDVKSTCVSLAPFVWGSYVVFSVGGQFLAVLDGQGRAATQATSFLVGSWIVSIPLFVVSFMLTDWGLRGLWISLIAGYIVTVIVAGVLIYFSKWPQIIKSSKERTENVNELTI